MASIANVTGNDTDLTSNCLPTSRTTLMIFEFAWDTVIVGIISVVGIIGNILSILTFSNFKVKTTTSVLLTALAVSDLLYLIVHGLLFQFLRSIYPGTGAFREYYVNVWPYMEVYEYPFSCMFQTLSAWFVILVAVDRYLAICWPLQARRLCTVPRAVTQIMLVTFAGIAIHIPRFFGTRIVYVLCSETLIPKKTATALGGTPAFAWTVGMLNVILAYLIPIVLLAVLNVRLVVGVRASAMHTTRLGSAKSTSSDEGSRSNRITLMLIVVVFVFLLCQIPQAVDHLFYTVPSFSWPDVSFYEVVCNTLVIFNSAFNFFVYVLFGRKFRTNVKELLSARQRRPSVTSVSSPTTREKLDSFSSSSTVEATCNGSPYRKHSGIIGMSSAVAIREENTKL